MSLSLPLFSLQDGSLGPQKAPQTTQKWKCQRGVTAAYWTIGVRLPQPQNPHSNHQQPPAVTTVEARGRKVYLFCPLLNSHKWLLTTAPKREPVGKGSWEM